MSIHMKFIEENLIFDTFNTVSPCMFCVIKRSFMAYIVVVITIMGCIYIIIHIIACILICIYTYKYNTHYYYTYNSICNIYLNITNIKFRRHVPSTGNQLCLYTLFHQTYVMYVCMFIYTCICAYIKGFMYTFGRNFDSPFNSYE